MLGAVGEDSHAISFCCGIEHQGPGHPRDAPPARLEGRPHVQYSSSQGRSLLPLPWPILRADRLPTSRHSSLQERGFCCSP